MSKLIFGFISRSLFVVKVFSVSMNIVFPGFAAVFWRQSVVLPEALGPYISVILLGKFNSDNICLFWLLFVKCFVVKYPLNLYKTPYRKAY